MERANPAVIRNALAMAHDYARSGLTFVCVPVNTDEQHQQALDMAHRNLDSMLADLEKPE